MRAYILPLLAVAALSAQAPAQAHVVLDLAEAPAASYQRIAFRVGHGCAGAATTGVEVRLPEGVVAARPMVKPGWTIAITTRALERPASNGHGLTREAPATIAWQGGPLPDAHYDEFVLMIRTPDAPGTSLAFPVVQFCEGGARHDWVETPSDATPRPRSPAPVLRLGAR